MIKLKTNKTVKVEDNVIKDTRIKIRGLTIDYISNRWVIEVTLFSYSEIIVLRLRNIDYWGLVKLQRLYGDKYVNKQRKDNPDKKFYNFLIIKVDKKRKSLLFIDFKNLNLFEPECILF